MTTNKKIMEILHISYKKMQLNTFHTIPYIGEIYLEKDTTIGYYYTVYLYHSKLIISVFLTKMIETKNVLSMDSLGVEFEFP